MTDNKLTDEQIIKAFEICYGIDKVLACTSCPLYDEEDFCQRGDISLEERVFDVYNRLKAEKEALINGQETLQKYIAELTAEIERLEIELKAMRGAANSYKAEVERLKEKSIADDKLLNDRVQEAVNSVSKANQKYVDALEKAFNNKVDELKIAKSEARKEFAERLESIYTNDKRYDRPDAHTLLYKLFENIDNLLEEMENK